MGHGFYGLDGFRRGRILADELVNGVIVASEADGNCISVCFARNDKHHLAFWGFCEIL
jgi:hypothetical protein